MEWALLDTDWIPLCAQNKEILHLVHSLIYNIKFSMSSLNTESTAPQIWFFTQALSSATHHPRLVTEVVYGMQSVDAGHACILQANNNATVVSPTSHAVSMLTDQNKIWFQAPGRKGVNM